jgi:hypothetical protein
MTGRRRGVLVAAEMVSGPVSETASGRCGVVVMSCVPVASTRDLCPSQCHTSCGLSPTVCGPALWSVGTVKAN